MSPAYCYHCGRHHPIEKMRQLTTRTGKRRLCVKSIEATKAARDALGKKITANNKAEPQSKARIMLHAAKSAPVGN